LDQGQADLLVTTLDQFIKQQPKGKIVALIDRTIGADAVVLNTQKYPQLKSQPEKISNLLEVYYRRIDANVREPVALLKQIADDGNLSEQEATAVLDGIDFFTSVEAKEWITDGTLETRIGSTAAVLVLSGKLNNVPANPNQLYTTQLINKAAANTETLISLVRADNPELADKLSGKGVITASASPSVTVNQVKTAPDIGNLTVRGEVKFDVGSSDLTLDSEATLQKLGQEIGEFNPQTVAVRITGHTSKTGSPDFNQQLSEQRAQAVVNYLRSLGLKHQLVAEGKGFYLPLSGIPAEDPRQQRTEIRLVRINQGS
jgi:outer membrane protein OmpA-like peptidoglycan-associated protein